VQKATNLVLIEVIGMGQKLQRNRSTKRNREHKAVSYLDTKQNLKG